MMWLELNLAVQSWVSSVKSSGLSTQPCGAPVLSVVVLEVLWPTRTDWGLPVRKSRIQLQRELLIVLGWTTAMLFWAGLPSNTIKPLQMIQNAAARLVFNEPKRAHVTPLFISLHWLPVAARIKFKTLMLAYRTTTGSAPSYFHSLLRIYIPSRSLRSASERRLVVPSQRGSKSLSRTFSFTIPGWWNNLPTPIRNAGSLSIFKQQLKTHLFLALLDFILKKKKKKKKILIFLSFPC